jgi:hypothetical protein
MTILIPHIYTPGFGDQQQASGLKFEVQDMTWRAIGGCANANINVTGKEDDLWRLVESLRSPIEIYDDYNRYAWWGYISGVTINAGPVRYGVDLDTMTNNVSIAYQGGTTAAIADAIGTVAYGRKDGRYTISSNNATAALAAGSAYLDTYRYPIPTVEFGQSPQMGAAISCRGWWNTLEWRYYTQGTTTVIDTVNQMGTILSIASEFLTAIRADATSGVLTPMNRDGSKTALDEIAELLKVGTGAGRRMIGYVNKARELITLVEPTADEYLVTGAGEVQMLNGQPVPAHLPPFGCWVRLKERLTFADTTRIADASRLFIEEVTWERENPIPRITARGALSPWDL